MKRDDDEFTVWALLLLPFSLIFLLVDEILALIKAIRFSPRRQEQEMQLLHADIYARAITNFDRDKDDFLDEIRDELDGVPDEALYRCLSFASAIWDIEDFEIPKPPPMANSIEGARYRDTLANLKDIKEHRACILDVLYKYLALLPMEGTGITFGMSLKTSIPGTILEQLFLPLYRDERRFPKTCGLLDRNLHKMSGLPYEPAHFGSSKLVLPHQYEGKEPVYKYAEGSPFMRLLDINVPISIPRDNLFEHIHIVGSTGSGKTQLLQYLIAQLADLDASLVIMDSQGDMIQKLLRYDGIDRDRFVIIDPTDVEYPIALNIFDVGQARLKNATQADYERQMNGAIDLILYVFASMLGAEATQKQSGLLKYVIRLLIHIPKATIHTLVEILSLPKIDRYSAYVAKLSPSAMDFFDNDFCDDKLYGSTKKEVMWRVRGLLENPAIERMFSSPETRFGMAEAMNSNKVVLINTAKEFLKGDACKFFGRFFVSLVAQATQERAITATRKDTFFIIDEAQDFIDSNIATMLEQARKYRVSITLAHQLFSQIPTGIQRTVLTNTSTKFVGRVSDQDARQLAGEMGATAQFLRGVGKLSFSLHSEGVIDQAVSVQVPAGYIEDRAERSNVDTILAQSRTLYAYRYQKPKPESPKPESPASGNHDDKISAVAEEKGVYDTGSGNNIEDWNAS